MNKISGTKKIELFSIINLAVHFNIAMVRVILCLKQQTIVAVNNPNTIQTIAAIFKASGSYCRFLACCGVT